MNTERIIENSNNISWFIASDDNKYIAFCIRGVATIWNVITDQKIYTHYWDFIGTGNFFVDDYLVTSYMIINLVKLFNNVEGAKFNLENICDPDEDPIFGSNILVNKKEHKVIVIRNIDNIMTCYTFDGAFISRFRTPNKRNDGRLEMLDDNFDFEKDEMFQNGIMSGIFINNEVYLQFDDNQEEEYEESDEYFNGYNFIKVNLTNGIITQLHFAHDEDNISKHNYRIFDNKTIKRKRSNILYIINENEQIVEYIELDIDDDNIMLQLSSSQNYYISDNALINAFNGIRFQEYDARPYTVKTTFIEENGIKIDDNLYYIRRINNINQLVLRKISDYRERRDEVFSNNLLEIGIIDNLIPNILEFDQILLILPIRNEEEPILNIFNLPDEEDEEDEEDEVVNLPENEIIFNDDE
jgi:hypothetical protein